MPLNCTLKSDSDGKLMFCEFYQNKKKLGGKQRAICGNMEKSLKYITIFLKLKTSEYYLVEIERKISCAWICRGNHWRTHKKLLREVLLRIRLILIRGKKMMRDKFGF